MNTTLLVLFLIAIVIIIVLSYYLYKCKTEKKPGQTRTPYYPRTIPYDTTQIVFWKKPGATDREFSDYIKAQFPKATATDIKYCGDCDNSLVVVTNIDINLFLSGQTPTTDPSRPTNVVRTGETVPAYFSPNFPMRFDDEIDRSQRKNYCHKIIMPDREAVFPDEKVTVAVFDTGVDNTVIGNALLYENNVASCMGAGANNGWNFADDIANWGDDDSSKHGSVVAKFIADQVYKTNNNGVTILPVKIFTKDGTCLLSDVLCALQYAKNRGADIINASFGFYAPVAYKEDDYAAAGTELFKEFLKAYFQDSTILMIAAAGNKDDVNEGYVYQSIDEVAKRDLGNVSFYPASFAPTIPSILAVTTASTQTNQVSPFQNFSEHVVDVGVNTDVIDGENYLFYHPFESNSMVQGSSFATPITTGAIASNYNLIKNLLAVPVTGSIKEAILAKLESEGILYKNEALAANLIKKKRMMNK